MATDRSARPDVRNPVLDLPAIARLQELPEDSRRALRAVLLDIRRDSADRAQRSWRQNKGPMAAYWKAVSVYAYHVARALR